MSQYFLIEKNFFSPHNIINLLFIFVISVVMHKDKDDGSHHDSHYRARELAALAAYDHQHLDGEMFLQVRWSLNPFSLFLINPLPLKL